MVSATDRPSGYSPTQITLHWIIAALIVVQFVAHDGMEHAWDAFEDGAAVAAGDMPMAYLHIACGLAVLVLAIARVWLRLTRGAPPLPANESAVVRIAAHGVHGVLYLLIFLVPLSGAAAWFLGLGPAGEVHQALKTVLLLVVAVHVLGALVQQFVFKSGVLTRMFRPAA
ncbi:MAG: cytochrome b/b6 domain-containing protein [Hyphomicrobiales bacterium]|nr:cytochrome b/b6 domain-containing protein [Hyphomicrobiales bacterium]